MSNTKHIISIAILTFFIGILYITDRTPYSDEYVYLGHADSIYKNQVFGEIDKETGDSISDARFAPLYPAFIAVLMYANRSFAESVECYLTNISIVDHDCKNNLYTIKITQLFIFSILLSYVWFLLFKISSSRFFSYACIVMILISGSPYYYANHFLTESLYLSPAFIFLLSLSISVIQKSIKFAVISAFFLGVTTLIRPTFLYLFYFLLILSPLIFIAVKKYRNNLREYFNIILTFTLVFFMIVGPWLVRNQIYFDKFAITIGYGDKPLATRVAHNEMTNKEYLAGWIYWLPDFGDSLATKWFGEENTKRLSFSDPESFYPEGRHVVDQKITDAITSGKYKNRIDAIFSLYIFSDPFNHAKVSLLLAWRGFFVEKYFGFIGLFVLVWAFVMGLKKNEREYFNFLFFPTMLLLFFQAAISISIARYNLILILPISFAYACLFNKVFDYSRQKLKKYGLLLK